MFAEHHRLIEEFPEYKEHIHNLINSSKEFAELYELYQRLDDEIYRIEAGMKRRTEEYSRELIENRRQIKGRLFEMIVD